METNPTGFFFTILLITFCTKEENNDLVIILNHRFLCPFMLVKYI